MARLKVELDPKNHVIPGENPEDFLQLAEEVETQYPPVGMFERVLVEQVITNTWRLRRYQRILPYVQAKGDAKSIASLEKMIAGIQRNITRIIKDIKRQQAVRAKEEAKAAKPASKSTPRKQKPQRPQLDDSLPPFYFIN